MGHLRPLAAALTLLALVGLGLAGLASTGIASTGIASTDTAPRVRLTDAAPARVEGAGFHAREAVRVTLTTATLRKTRRVVAGPGGGFASVWTGVFVDVCSAWKVVAAGSEGSTALAHSRPHACLPPPDR
jgi:hypothetical protein